MKALRIVLIAFIIGIFPLNAQIGGYALKFDGVDDYLSTTYNTQISNYTVECWVKGNAAPSSSPASGVVHKDLNFNITWDHADPAYRGAAAVNVNDVWYPASFGALEGGKWYHLAMTYDGETLRSYKNGKLVTENSAPSGSPTTDPNPLTIGKHNTASNFFGGTIDEVRIWNVVKTEAEITANMYKEIGTNANLKLYYKMNDGSGTTTTDNSGNSYTGTLQGAPLWKASGALAGPGNCLDFTSTGDHVEIPDAASLEFTNAVSVEAWIKPTTFATNYWEGVIFEKGGSSSYGVQLRGGGTGQMEFLIGGTNWQAQAVTSGINALELNKWQHVCGTYDGLVMKLYVNGNMVASTNTTLTISSRGSYVGNIGRSEQYQTREFTGYIDEVRLWNIARTPDQVRETMMRTLIGNEDNLKAYYRLDEASSTIAYDYTINANNGTMTNMDAATDHVASGAFNTWIGAESSSGSTASNWSTGAIPNYQSIGVYKWPDGNSLTLNYSPVLHNVYIAGSSDPTLTSGFSLNNNLFVNDDLDLAGQTIVSGQKAYFVEGTGRILGTTGMLLGYYYTIPANTGYRDFQNMGFAISTPLDLTDVTVDRRHNINSNDWGTSISRNFTISQAAKDSPPPVNPGVRFTYNDAELNGIAESKLLLAQSTDNGVTWVTYPDAVVNTTDNTVTQSDVSSVYGIWTLTNKDNPLPVELTSFTASTTGNTVTLNWETKTEVMNHGFEVERKTGTTEWQKIGFIEGHGTSNSPKYYSFTDKLEADGKVFYRLKQIDTDGQFEYSPETVVEIGLPTEFSLSRNYPNPFNPETIIRYAVPVAGHVTLTLYDIRGSMVATLVDEAMEPGNHVFELDAVKLGLTSGVYFYRINVTGEKGFSAAKKLVLMK